MILYQLLTILYVTALFGGVITLVAKQFGARIKHFLPIFAILLTFATGFALRLSGDANIVDIGFFLTEISGVISTLLFTAALLLGQVKYHGVK